jgi:imidazolonepropionase-like amidohydrolase
LGLVEIGLVRATRDQQETGTLNPNVRANVSVNPDSELIPVTRSNGVLLALTAPSGGLVSGTSAVLQLDGWTYEDMTLQPDVALHINWPRMTPATSGGDEKQSQAQIKQRDEQLQQLRDLFAEARAYQKARNGNSNGQRHDARLEALVPVIERRRPIIVHADRAAQIQSAVAFAAEQELKLIIQGGYDAPLCADLLKKHNVPVIVSAVYRLPARRDDAYDAPYTLPARLYEAEIPFCISGTESSRVWNTRNLPYHAATAAAYGLPREEALKAVTLSPAQILGVADRVGSLEAGKDATLIVTSGDPLDTASRVISAYIQGRELDLTDRHKQLYRKYREKYRRLQEAGAEVAGP